MVGSCGRSLYQAGVTGELLSKWNDSYASNCAAMKNASIQMTETNAIFLSDHVPGSCHVKTAETAAASPCTTMFAFNQSHLFVANILGFSLCRHCSSAARALADDNSPASIGMGSHVGNLSPTRHMGPKSLVVDVLSAMGQISHLTCLSVHCVRPVNRPEHTDNYDH